MVKYFIFIIQIGILSASYAQEQAKVEPAAVHSLSDSTQVKQRLEELFKHVRANDIEKMAPYLIYRGKDLSRKWQTVLQYSDEADRKEVTRVYQRLKNLLERIDGKYTYDQFMYDSNGPWYVWNVGYDLNGNSLSIGFAFRKIGSEFCLGDIDE